MPDRRPHDGPNRVHQDVPTGWSPSWDEALVQLVGDAVEEAEADHNPREASWGLHGVRQEDCQDTIQKEVGRHMDGLIHDPPWYGAYSHHESNIIAGARGPQKYDPHPHQDWSPAQQGPAHLLGSFRTFQ